MPSFFSFRLRPVGIFLVAMSPLAVLGIFQDTQSFLDMIFVQNWISAATCAAVSNKNSDNRCDGPNGELTYFEIRISDLTGTIPPLSLIPYVTTFSVYENLLTGTIPSLTANAALDTLSIYDNKLTGSIPRY